MSNKEPKEFWILKRAGCSDIVFDRKPSFEHSAGIVHVIEKPVYDKLQDENKILREALEACSPAWLPENIRHKRREALNFGVDKKFVPRPAIVVTEEDLARPDLDFSKYRPRKKE